MVYRNGFACFVGLLGLMTLAACQAKLEPVVSVKADETIQVPLGTKLAVQIPGNPSTGYVWQVDTYNHDLLKRDGKAHYEPKDDRMAGAGGMYTFTFVPQKAGESSVKFTYRRPWMTDAEDADVFVLNVQVVPQRSQHGKAPEVITVQREK